MRTKKEESHKKRTWRRTIP